MLHKLTLNSRQLKLVDSLVREHYNSHDVDKRDLNRLVRQLATEMSEYAPEILEPDAWYEYKDVDLDNQEF